MTQLSYTSCRKSPNIESSIFLINSKEQNICSNSTHIDTQHYGGNSVLKNACQSLFAVDRLERWTPGVAETPVPTWVQSMEPS